MTELALHLFPEAAAAAIVGIALDEDLGSFPGSGVTTAAAIPAAQRSTAHVVAREDGVVAGLPLATVVFRAITERLGSAEVDVEPRHEERDLVRRGRRPGRPARLHPGHAGERPAEPAQRLSGIATGTPGAGPAHRGHRREQCLDTRQDHASLRALEKYAVRCGGGTNKRRGPFRRRDQGQPQAHGPAR